MKKLFYLAFCLTAALSLGCVVLTYPCITDVGCDNGQNRFSVNTNGKAHVTETTHVSQSTGAKEFEHVSFIDQAANGSQHVTGYQCAHAAGSSNFHSDTYCNPDWTGCAWLVNDYNCDPGAACSFAAPGVSINYNCIDISALGLCYSSRVGECGRSLRTPKNMSPTEIAQLITLGREGHNTLTYDFNAGNTSLTMEFAGGAVVSPTLGGNYEVTLNLKKGRMILPLGPNHWANERRLGSIIDANGKNFNLTVNYGGLTRTFPIAAFSGDFYRKIAAQNN